mgnify:CR=1 FL=1
MTNLVSKKTLVKISHNINLSDLILTSKSYSQKYRITDSMLADSLEALIGASRVDSQDSITVISSIGEQSFFQPVIDQLLSSLSRITKVLLKYSKRDTMFIIF